MDKKLVNKQVIRKIKKAKNILADIFNLTLTHKDGHIPNGYGNQELNKATDAMYEYIKEMESIDEFINN